MALPAPLPRRAPRALLPLAILAGATLAAAGCQRRVPWSISSSDPLTRRHLASGDIVGGRGRYDSHAWLGIPYAAPPVGELRWRAPRPPAPWTGVREALVPGAPCAQYPSPLGGVEGPAGTVAGREDCLTLSVWAPPAAPDAVPTGARRLPVLVWIHGGGNSIGQAAFYDGGHLATRENTVVVALQYRLGPFGWFRHAALRGGADPLDASGNFGTLDLVRALEWVRDNAAAFGGDPGNVTIFGESAGGQNVYTLLLSPQARGLFHRAIVESGGLAFTPPGEAEALADGDPPGAAQSSGEAVLRLLVADGSAADRDGARELVARAAPAELARRLRAKTTAEVLAAYTPDPNTGMIDHPRVFAEGTVLPVGDGVENLRAGRWNRVPVLVGTNRDENRLFHFGDPQRITKRFWILPRFIDERAYATSADALSRSWKATGADAPVRAMHASGEPRVFVYRFDWDEEPTVLGADLAAMLGAAHGFEIPFVFGHFDLGRAGNAVFTKDNAAGRETLSAAMMSYWAAFARDGAPGRGSRGDLPQWAAWQPDGPAKTFVLDTAAGGGLRMTDAEETVDGVVAAVKSDPRLVDDADRCRVLADLARWQRGFGRAGYEQAGCAAFPRAAAR